MLIRKRYASLLRRRAALTLPDAIWIAAHCSRAHSTLCLWRVDIYKWKGICVYIWSSRDVSLSLSLSLSLHAAWLRGIISFGATNRATQKQFLQRRSYESARARSFRGLSSSLSPFFSFLFPAGRVKLTLVPGKQILSMAEYSVRTRTVSRSSE